MHVLRALLTLRRRDRRVHADSFSTVVAVDPPTREDVPDEVREPLRRVRARSKSTPSAVGREPALDPISESRRGWASQNAWESEALKQGASATAAAANAQVTQQLREMRRGRVIGGSGVMALQRMTDEAFIDGFMMSMGDRPVRA